MLGRTVAKPVILSGTGVHTGAPCRVEIRPAAPGTGIVFFSAGVRIPAVAAYVVDTRRCTTLGVGGVRIGTVEHLMAALAGLGVTDVEAHVNGPEIPALDGGSADIVRALTAAGFTDRGVLRTAVVVRPGSLQTGHSRYEWHPADAWIIAATVLLPAGAGGPQSFTWRVEPSSFATDVAPAKTFCVQSEVEALRAAGLGRGGSERTVVVIGDAGVVNPDVCTFADECARHKVLDLLGDLALLGMRVRGLIRAMAPGHAGNLELVRRLADACDVISA